MTFGPIDKPKENAVETRASFYYLEEGLLIHIINKPKDLHGIEDAKENIVALRNMSNGVPHLLLIDVTHIKSIERGARELYASEGNPHRVKAVALLTNSIVGRIVGNFFIGFNKPEVPTRLFIDERLARSWLAKQV